VAIGHSLALVLAKAACGEFPPADGSVLVAPAPTPYACAVVAFTAYSVIGTDLDSDEVRAHLPDADLGAPMSAGFLHWLGQRVGSTPGVLDAVLAHVGVAATHYVQPLVPYVDAEDHPRLARARRLRRELQVYGDPQGSGLVILGRGLVGRWEISLELDPLAQGRGLGRAMIASARALLPADEPVFAQVSPGNARSLRSFLAAGFRPIGSEVIFA